MAPGFMAPGFIEGIAGRMVTGADRVGARSDIVRSPSRRDCVMRCLRPPTLRGDGARRLDTGRLRLPVRWCRAASHLIEQIAEESRKTHSIGASAALHRSPLIAITDCWSGPDLRPSATWWPARPLREAAATARRHSGRLAETMGSPAPPFAEAHSRARRRPRTRCRAACIRRRLRAWSVWPPGWSRLRSLD